MRIGRFRIRPASSRRTFRCKADIDGTPPPLHKKDIAITPLATFSITARVLSRADYRWDTAAAISPVDLALGWGRMSDTAVLDKIDIWQSGRFYYWRVAEFPIPEREIIESSANMHLMPADSSVERAIDRVKQGDVVTFDGYLIEARWPDGGVVAQFAHAQRQRRGRVRSGLGRALLDRAAR